MATIDISLDSAFILPIVFKLWVLDLGWDLTDVLYYTLWQFKALLVKAWPSLVDLPIEIWWFSSSQTVRLPDPSFKASKFDPRLVSGIAHSFVFHAWSQLTISFANFFFWLCPNHQSDVIQILISTFLSRDCLFLMCVSENSVPLKPMVLLIIIPFLNG